MKKIIHARPASLNPGEKYKVLTAPATDIHGKRYPAGWRFEICSDRLDMNRTNAATGVPELLVMGEDGKAVTFR